MRNAFCTMAGPAAGGPASPGVYALGLSTQEVDGCDREALVHLIGRLVRRAGELPATTVRELPQDTPTAIGAPDGGWLAVVNTAAENAGWVVLDPSASALARLGSGRLVLCGSPGATLTHVPAACADRLPPAPAPQWGTSAPGRSPHV
ncbi:hypothetical protein OG782_17150 [Streptomyces sp. NBC_00876]|uniref:hypothetical protein n=1 Tax=Streptomyces sp. NBC_00876 TaxID=2975853 RepID=UPI0038633620|nr:hypothetical protein OG782_17150 [Streptomyces sp. NBC_00876]